MSRIRGVRDWSKIRSTTTWHLCYPTRDNSTEVEAYEVAWDAAGMATVTGRRKQMTATQAAEHNAERLLDGEDTRPGETQTTL